MREEEDLGQQFSDATLQFYRQKSFTEKITF